MAAAWGWNPWSDARHSAADRSVTERDRSVVGVIESGDFRIDLAERAATLCGRQLDPTMEEFDVLVFLSGHPQSMVTPKTMLRTNGAANCLRQTQFLRVLLSLRQKLGAASPAKHYLRTELWVIYRFDPASSAE